MNVPQFSGEVRTHLAVTEDDYVEPKNVYKAKQGDDWHKWHRTMKDEVKAFQDNETCNPVRPPTDRDAIPGKWVYKVKLGPSGQLDKYKARYVAKGKYKARYVTNTMTLCSNRWMDRTTLRLLRLPVRHSGFYFNYQQSRAM